MSEPNGNGAPLDNSGRSSLTPRIAPRGMIEIEPSDREEVKYRLRPGIAMWCERVLEGVKVGERNAMNLFAKAIGVAGADVELNINVLATKELGMTIDEARRKISMVTMVEGIDESDAVSVMEQHVRAWYRERGKRVVIVDDAAEVSGG